MYPKINVSSRTPLNYANGEYVIECHLGYLTVDFTENTELSELRFDKDLLKAFRFSLLEVSTVFELLKPYSVFTTFQIKQLDFNNYGILVTDNGKFFPDLKLIELTGGRLENNESIVLKSFYSETKDIYNLDEFFSKASKRIYNSHFTPKIDKLFFDTLNEPCQYNPKKIKNFKYLTIKVLDSLDTLLTFKVENLGLFFSDSSIYSRQVIELRVLEFENKISPYCVHINTHMGLTHFFDFFKVLKDDLVNLHEKGTDFKVEFIVE